MTSISLFPPDPGNCRCSLYLGGQLYSPYACGTHGCVPLTDSTQQCPSGPPVLLQTAGFPPSCGWVTFPCVPVCACEHVCVSAPCVVCVQHVHVHVHVSVHCVYVCMCIVCIVCVRAMHRVPVSRVCVRVCAHVTCERACVFVHVCACACTVHVCVCAPACVTSLSIHAPRDTPVYVWQLQRLQCTQQGSPLFKTLTASEHTLIKRIVGSQGSSMFNVSRTLLTVLQSGCPTCIPTNSARGAPFSTVSPAPVASGLFGNSHSRR